MAQTGDIMGNHDTVLRNISLHYTKQSPYFPALCAQVPQNSQPSFHTSTAPSASACAAYPAIPWHCTLSLPSTHSSCSFIFAPGRLANPILLLQTCPATAHIYTFTYIYIYTYTYTHTYNHIFYYSVAMLSSVCCQPNCLSHSLQSHAPQKRWVGGTRAVALLITMVYNTCN